MTNETCQFMLGGERVQVTLCSDSSISETNPEFEVRNPQTGEEWYVNGDTLVDEYRPVSTYAENIVTDLQL